MPLSLTAIIRLESSIETGTSLIKDGYKYINLLSLFLTRFSSKIKIFYLILYRVCTWLGGGFPREISRDKEPPAVVVALSLGTSNRREPTNRYVVDRLQVDACGGERTDGYTMMISPDDESERVT